MAEAPANRTPFAKRRIGSVVTWLIGGAILFAFYESIVLVLVGMAPTIVALVIDRRQNKSVARTVGYLNFAGCLPWLIDYWMGGGGFERVFEMLGGSWTLMTMYASAGVGWLLYFAMRPVAAAYLAVASDMRQSQVVKQQQQLVEEWGEGVREAARRRIEGVAPAGMKRESTSAE